MATPSESRLFVWANGNFLTAMSCFFAGGNLLTNFGGGGGSGYETFVTLSLVFSIPVSAGEQGQGARKWGVGAWSVPILRTTKTRVFVNKQGHSVPIVPHLKVPLFPCSPGSNTRGEVEGL